MDWKRGEHWIATYDNNNKGRQRVRNAVCSTAESWWMDSADDRNGREMGMRRAGERAKVRRDVGRGRQDRCSSEVLAILWKSVRTENTVLSFSDSRIGIVQLGVQSARGKTWLSSAEDNVKKKGIEHEWRSRNFGTRNGRLESNILVKNQREQRRVHKGQGDCRQWHNSGQCTKGDQCSCWNFWNKREKVTTQPSPFPQQTT